ncbi:hypothetical protein RRG08_056122 [Elysia crispata]|uniref:Uncharacterized protein n=1 Tax=Elysia crispata TaxID=231223 RepID=A0AAE0YWD0_9GAST|nr:hypothetical protein RRG08_056122 [Elysia crispata]
MFWHLQPRGASRVIGNTRIQGDCVETFLGHRRPLVIVTKTSATSEHDRTEQYYLPCTEPGGLSSAPTPGVYHGEKMEGPELSAILSFRNPSSPGADTEIDVFRTGQRGSSSQRTVGHRLGGRRPDIEGSSRQSLVSSLRQVSEGALVVWSNDRCHLEEYGQCLDGHSSFALTLKPHQEALMVKSRHTDRSVSTSSLQQPERSRQAGHGQSRKPTQTVSTIHEKPITPTLTIRVEQFFVVRVANLYRSRD